MPVGVLLFSGFAGFLYSAAGCLSYSQVNMKNIRKKMGVTPGEKRYIINELGVGYRMLAEDET